MNKCRLCSSLLTGRICEELVHATDWLPTLYAAGGGNVQSLGKIDGYNIWDTISNSEASPRFEVLHGVDTFSELSGALRVGDYKLIVNQDDSYYGDWYPRPDVPIPKGMNKRKRRQIIEGNAIQNKHLTEAHACRHWHSQLDNLGGEA